MRIPRRSICNYWLAGLLLLIPAGCHVFHRSQRLNEGEAVIVPLRVLKGQDGAALAFVPVTIEGQGPFAFVLDTGASNSLVDEDVARKLDLPLVGVAPKVRGVAGSAKAAQVQIQQWSIGDIELPPWTVISMEMKIHADGSAAVGLLGSDVLSQFDVVTVDYDRQKLILGGRR
jgi:predicted aspartyl protease